MAFVAGRWCGRPNREEVVEVKALCRDVTKRLHAEGALPASEETPVERSRALANLVEIFRPDWGIDSRFGRVEISGGTGAWEPNRPNLPGLSRIC